jgi:DNA-binding SARP family transcriptional activator/predicted ATPase
MLDIRLLGEQRVAVDGTPVAAAQTPRATALLAQLLLHTGEDVARATLASLFWPDSTDEQALTNLRRELHQLRRALLVAPDCLVSDARHLRWVSQPHCRSDVEDFLHADALARGADAADDGLAFAAAAEQAVSHYSGDLLPASYDDWVLDERDRLRRRCVELLDQLVAHHERHDAVGHAVAFARRRTELEPLEEAGYRTLMDLQARAGDRAAALNSYHRCASLLERELGVAPDPATTALYERLVGRPSPRRSSTTKTPQRAADAPPPLIGRDQPMSALAQRWASAVAGQPGLHVITGEAGVGKSRLIDEVALRVERTGANVARARCFAGRARLALAPVAEWLGSRALVAQRDQIDPLWAAEVDRLVPPAAGSPRAAPQPMVDGWQRHRFFEGMVWAVLAGDRPTLLVLDDVQWCDPDTLTWLDLLFRLGPRSPVLVLAGARAEEMADNSDLTDAMRALRRDGLVSNTELAPLDAPATEALIRHLGGVVVDPASVHAATGGYPLFVIESSRGGGPAPTSPDVVGRLPRVHAVLSGRLAQLGPEALDVAHLASAVGRDFSLDLLTEASDLPQDTVVSAVDELWRRRIVVQHSSTTYDFAHDLLRDTAYDETSPPHRALLHRRIAQALELLHPDQPNAVAAVVADQYDRAGLSSRAVRAHVRAAEAATALFANDDAIRHYDRALKLLAGLPSGPDRDRDELAICHAMSAPLNARFGYASTRLQHALERAADLAHGLGERRLHLLSLAGLFAVKFVQGHTEESYAVAHRSLALSADHPDVVGQAHFAVAGGATSLGRLAEAIPHFELAQELTAGYPPSLVGTRPEVHARAWSAHALWLAGRGDEAHRWADWAIQRARDVDHPYSLAVALAYAAITAQLDEDRVAAADFGQQTFDLCRRYGFAYYREWGAILLGWSSGGEAGIRQIRRGLHALDEQGAFARRPYYLYLLARCLLDEGRGEDAGAVLDAARAAATARHDVWWLPEILRLQAAQTPGAPRRALLEKSLELAREHGSVALAARTEADLGHPVRRRGVRRATVPTRSAER